MTKIGYNEFMIGIKRDLTEKLIGYLDVPEVLLLVGARQTGKTTILRQLEAIIKEKGQTCFFLTLEDPDYLQLLNQSPKNLLQIFPFPSKKRVFVLMDEIQYLKRPTNFLKYFYDQYQGQIKIIASGSSAFWLDRKFRDSLVGRKRIFTLYPLSFREFLRFRGKTSLSQKDFSQLSLSEQETLNIYFHEYLVFGGYPRVVLAPAEEKEAVLTDIAYSYIKKDVFEARIRDEETFYRLFRLLASQVGQLVNLSELASTLGVSKTMIENYLLLMQKSFHLALIRPFSRNLRKELTKMPKVYFFDLGLRNFLVRNLNPFPLRPDQGILLENAVFRQLLENYSLEVIRFWRTTNQQEVDFVVNESQAFEVKLNPQRVRLRPYQYFQKKYPQIKLQLIGWETEAKQVGPLPVKNLWEIY